MRLEAGRRGPGGERRLTDLIAALVGLGVGALVWANVKTRNTPVFCPACRTQSLRNVRGNVTFRCTQCAAEFTRIGLQLVRQRADGGESERVPSATATIKEP